MPFPLTIWCYMKNKYLFLSLISLLLPVLAWSCEYHQQPMFGWAGGTHKLPMLKAKRQPNFNISSNRLKKTALGQVVSVDVNYKALKSNPGARINLKASKNVQLLSAISTEIQQSAGKHKVKFKVLTKGYSYIQVSIVSDGVNTANKDHHTIYIPLAKAS